MTTKLKYKVVHGTTTSELEGSVKMAIVDGWSPQGGIAICVSDGRSYFYQAMVRTGD